MIKEKNCIILREGCKHFSTLQFSKFLINIVFFVCYHYGSIKLNVVKNTELLVIEQTLCSYQNKLNDRLNGLALIHLPLILMYNNIVIMFIHRDIPLHIDVIINEMALHSRRLDFVL